MEMIVTYFQFARRLAEEILIRGDACCISAVVSDYNMPCSL